MCAEWHQTSKVGVESAGAGAGVTVGAFKGADTGVPLSTDKRSS
jgi:hypothetical protein